MHLIRYLGQRISSLPKPVKPISPMCSMISPWLASLIPSHRPQPAPGETAPPPNPKQSRKPNARLQQSQQGPNPQHQQRPKQNPEHQQKRKQDPEHQQRRKRHPKHQQERPGPKPNRRHPKHERSAGQPCVEDGSPRSLRSTKRRRNPNNQQTRQQCFWLVATSHWPVPLRGPVI